MSGQLRSTLALQRNHLDYRVHQARAWKRPTIVGSTTEDDFLDAILNGLKLLRSYHKRVDAMRASYTAWQAIMLSLPAGAERDAEAAMLQDSQAQFAAILRDAEVVIDPLEDDVRTLRTQIKHFYPGARTPEATSSPASAASSGHRHSSAPPDVAAALEPPAPPLGLGGPPSPGHASQLSAPLPTAVTLAAPATSVPTTTVTVTTAAISQAMWSTGMPSIPAAPIAPVHLPAPLIAVARPASAPSAPFAAHIPLMPSHPTMMTTPAVPYPGYPATGSPPGYATSGPPPGFGPSAFIRSGSLPPMPGPAGPPASHLVPPSWTIPVTPPPAPVYAAPAPAPAAYAPVPAPATYAAPAFAHAYAPAAAPTPATELPKLPPLELPSFSGEAEDWLSFRETFLQRVDARTGLSDVDKYLYLAHALKGGSAAAFTKGFEASPLAYREAWVSLEREYGDATALRLRLQEKLQTLPEPQESDVDATWHLLREVEQLCRQMRHLGEDPDNNTFVETAVYTKLPKWLKAKILELKQIAIPGSWNTEALLTVSNNAVRLQRSLRDPSGDHADKGLNTFAVRGENFSPRPELKGRVDRAQGPADRRRPKSKGPPENRNRQARGRTPRRSPHRQPGRGRARAADRRRPPCRLCNSDDGHLPSLCPRYKTPAARVARARELRLCTQCLKPGHDGPCTAIFKCPFSCGTNVHHPAVCPRGPGAEAPRPATTAAVVATTTMASAVANTTLVTLAPSERQLLPSRRVTVANPRTGRCTQAVALLDTCSNTSYITERAARRLGLRAQAPQALELTAFATSTRSVESSLYVVEVLTQTGDSRQIVAQSISELIGEIPALSESCLTSPQVQIESVKPDILIGSDYLDRIVRLPTRILPTGHRALVTDLGDVPFGSAYGPGRTDGASLTFLVHSTPSPQGTAEDRPRALAEPPSVPVTVSTAESSAWPERSESHLAAPSQGLASTYTAPVATSQPRRSLAVTLARARSALRLLWPSGPQSSARPSPPETTVRRSTTPTRAPLSARPCPAVAAHSPVFVTPSTCEPPRAVPDTPLPTAPPRRPCLVARRPRPSGRLARRIPSCGPFFLGDPSRGRVVRRPIGSRLPRPVRWVQASQPVRGVQKTLPVVTRRVHDGRRIRSTTAACRLKALVNAHHHFEPGGAGLPLALRRSHLAPLVASSPAPIETEATVPPLDGHVEPFRASLCSRTKSLPETPLVPSLPPAGSIASRPSNPTRSSHESPLREAKVFLDERRQPVPPSTSSTHGMRLRAVTGNDGRPLRHVVSPLTAVSRGLPVQRASEAGSRLDVHAPSEPRRLRLTLMRARLTVLVLVLLSASSSLASSHGKRLGDGGTDTRKSERQRGRLLESPLPDHGIAPRGLRGGGRDPSSCSGVAPTQTSAWACSPISALPPAETPKAQGDSQLAVAWPLFESPSRVLGPSAPNPGCQSLPEAPCRFAVGGRRPQAGPAPARGRGRPVTRPHSPLDGSDPHSGTGSAQARPPLGPRPTEDTSSAIPGTPHGRADVLLAPGGAAAPSRDAHPRPARLDEDPSVVARSSDRGVPEHPDTRGGGRAAASRARRGRTPRGLRSRGGSAGRGGPARTPRRAPSSSKSPIGALWHATSPGVSSTHYGRMPRTPPRPQGRGEGYPRPARAPSAPEAEADRPSPLLMDAETLIPAVGVSALSLVAYRALARLASVARFASSRAPRALSGSWLLPFCFLLLGALSVAAQPAEGSPPTDPNAGPSPAQPAGTDSPNSRPQAPTCSREAAIFFRAMRTVGRCPFSGGLPFPVTTHDGRQHGFERPLPTPVVAAARPPPVPPVPARRLFAAPADPQPAPSSPAPCWCGRPVDDAHLCAGFVLPSDPHAYGRIARRMPNGSWTFDMVLLPGAVAPRAPPRERVDLPSMRRSLESEYQRRLAREADPPATHAELQQHVALALAAVLLRLGHHAGCFTIHVLMGSLLLGTVSGCSTTGAAMPAAKCHREADQLVCEAEQLARLELPEVGSSACLALTDAQNRIHGLYTVKVIETQALCLPAVSHFTRSSTVEVVSSSRCHLAGSCSDLTCENLTRDQIVPEAGEAAHYPGSSRCARHGGGWGGLCPSPFEGCLFARLHARPASDRILQVMKCSWLEQIVVEVSYQTTPVTLVRQAPPTEFARGSESEGAEPVRSPESEGVATARRSEPEGHEPAEASPAGSDDHLVSAPRPMSPEPDFAHRPTSGRRVRRMPLLTGAQAESEELSRTGDQPSTPSPASKAAPAPTPHGSATLPARRSEVLTLTPGVARITETGLRIVILGNLPYSTWWQATYLDDGERMTALDDESADQAALVRCPTESAARAFNGSCQFDEARCSCWLQQDTETCRCPPAHALHDLLHQPHAVLRSPSGGPFALKAAVHGELLLSLDSQQRFRLLDEVGDATVNGAVLIKGCLTCGRPLTIRYSCSSAEDTSATLECQGAGWEDPIPLVCSNSSEPKDVEVWVSASALPSRCLVRRPDQPDQGDVVAVQGQLEEPSRLEEPARNARRLLNEQPRPVIKVEVMPESNALFALLGVILAVAVAVAALLLRAHCAASSSPPPIIVHA